MKNTLIILAATFLSTIKILALPKMDIQHASKTVQYKNFPSDISEYNYLDPKRLIPTEPLIQAVRFYRGYYANIKNRNSMTIIDMTQHSSKKRMYVIDMKTGAVSTYLAAHGKNSDSNNDGYADKFSNADSSLMTSLGFYLTGEAYSGSNGLSLRLMGLEKTNSNAMSRYIVMHGADYISPSHVGRSYGCPAIEKKYVQSLIPALKSKSLLYIYKK